MIDPKKRAAAERALKDAVLAMSRTSQGMLPVYMGLRQRATEDPAVTVRLNVGNCGVELEYNVDFVTKLETSMLGAVVYMQCLKVALHHCDHRKKEPLSMLKLASDIVVAEYARKVVDTSRADNYEILNRLFPSIWEHWDVLGKHGFMPENDLVLEKLFSIFSEEQESIEKQKGMKPREEREQSSSEGEPGEDGEESGEASDEGEPQDSKSGGDEGEGEGEDSDDSGESSPGDSGEQREGDGDNPGEGEGEGDKSDEGDGEPGDGEPGEGEGDGDSDGDGEAEGDTGDAPAAPGAGTGNYEAMEKYFSLESAEAETENWAQDEAATDRITATVMDALDKGMFDRMRGKLPLALRDANRLKVDTAAMFRKFLTSVMDDETRSSWGRRNRKYMKYGVIAPGYLYDETPRILMCVDVSGSMYVDNLIGECLKVMDAVCNGISVDLVYWDAVCSPVFDTPKTIKEVEIYGGGYTNPDCVLQKLGPDRFKYDGLVFITDCEFSWNEPPRARQIMILRAGDRKYDFPSWCVYKDELKNFINK